MISISAACAASICNSLFTDGCPGLAGAIQTIYPRVLHQRCWVHKIRNIREKGRKRDRDELKQMAQAIYLAEGRKQARAALRCFKLRWQAQYPTMVKQLEKVCRTC
jgi:putative transposase